MVPEREGVAKLCRLVDIPDGDARGIELARAVGRPLQIIVVRRDPEVFAYLNRCPHRGTPLDWAPDRFLDAERRHLVCATHGAIFRIHDGVCVAGPCQGDGLRVIDCEVRDGEVWTSSLPSSAPG
jgi:nitrite reductase/ring-hydroxylating ferredoxin subunit